MRKVFLNVPAFKQIIRIDGDAVCDARNDAILTYADIKISVIIFKNPI